MMRGRLGDVGLSIFLPLSSYPFYFSARDQPRDRLPFLVPFDCVISLRSIKLILRAQSSRSNRPIQAFSPEENHIKWRNTCFRRRGDRSSAQTVFMAVGI